MQRKAIAWFVTVALVLAVFGCRLPWGGGGEQSPPINKGSGTLVLSLNPTSVLVARTITPDGNMEIHHYTITGTGPGASFYYEDYTDDTLVQTSLEPGTWTVEVQAYSADGELIGEGAQDITVTSGAAVTVVLQVSPVEGPGTLEILITWPENVLTTPEVTGVLTPVGDPSQGMDFTTTPTSALYVWDGIPRGYYAVSLHLADENESVWGTVEAARIMAGVRSYRHYELVEDVNRGGGGVVIVPDLEDPIEVAIEDVIDPLQAGEPMTATANTFGVEVDSYQWYLNGDSVGGDSPVVDLPGLDPGHYWLDLLVTKGPVMSSANREFQVVGSGTEIVDLTGYWDLLMSEPGDDFLDFGTLLYILQTEDQIDGSWGFTGSVSDSTVLLTLEMEDDGSILLQEFTGTLAGGCVTGTFEAWEDGVYDGDGIWEMCPTVVEFGDFQVDTTSPRIDLDTEFGMAEVPDTETEHVLRLYYSDAMTMLNLDLDFIRREGSFNPGVYAVNPGPGEEEMEVRAHSWLAPEQEWFGEAWNGTLDIQQINETELLATITDLDFTGENPGDPITMFSGTITPDMNVCAGHSVTFEGTWMGEPYMGTSCVMLENMLWQETNMNIGFLDHRELIMLWLFTETGFEETTYTFGDPAASVGAELEWFDEDTGTDVAAEVVGGSLTITTLIPGGEDAHLTGTYQLDLEWEEGGSDSVSGGFDVPLNDLPY